ncbi:MAG: tetratricopeptide repeat protein [Ruminococcus sp.]|jgi:tetratricopeptide (TPR) repeat protein
MIGYRLCQTKKAENPYFVENISTNIFTMEELCFYMSQNLYLLDETILNEGLVRWLKEELGLDLLSRRLHKLLEEKASMAELILPVMKEIQYLNQAELKELQQKLKQMEEQPPLMRGKLKGDYLAGYHKYGNALKVYDEVLKNTDETVMGSQFKGSVWHNMGCAYARLFQMDEAMDCFEKAYDLLHSRDSMKSCLLAAYLQLPREEFLKKAGELKAGDSLIQELEKEITRVLTEEDSDDEAVTEEILAGMTEEYHKSTGW